MAESVGKFAWLLTTDASAYSAGLSRARDEGRKFAADMKGITGGLGGGATSLVQQFLPDIATLGSIAGVAALFHSVTQEAMAFVREAANLETSVENVQKLHNAAAVAQVEFDKLSGAMGRLEKAVGEAFTEGGKPAEHLKRLGLSVKELVGMRPDEMLEATAKKLMAIENPALRAAAGMELFGKGFKQIEPVLKELAKGGIGGLGGPIASTTAVTALAEFGKGTAGFWREIKTTFTEIAGQALHLGLGLGQAEKSQAQLSREAEKERQIRAETARLMKEQEESQKRAAESAKRIADDYKHISESLAKIAIEQAEAGMGSAERALEAALRRVRQPMTPSEFIEQYRVETGEAFAPAMEAEAASKRRLTELRDQWREELAILSEVAAARERLKKAQEDLDKRWFTGFLLPSSAPSKRNAAQAVSWAADELEHAIAAAGEAKKRMNEIKAGIEDEQSGAAVSRRGLGLQAEEATEAALRAKFQPFIEAEQAAKRWAEEQREIDAALKQTVTHEEQFTAELRKAHDWRQRNKITAEEEAKLVARAQHDLVSSWMSSSGRAEFGRGGLEGSREAYESIIRAQADQQNRDVMGQRIEAIKGQLGEAVGALNRIAAAADHQQIADVSDN